MILPFAPQESRANFSFKCFEPSSRCKHSSRADQNCSTGNLAEGLGTGRVRIWSRQESPENTWMESASKVICTRLWWHFVHGLCAWFLCKQWRMLAVSRVQKSNELVGGCCHGNSGWDSSCSHHLVPSDRQCTSWIRRRRQNLIKTPSWLEFLAAGR